MKNFPSKPIEKACVYFAGERAAGIPATHFYLDIFIDLSCLANNDQAKHLANCRAKISQAYEEMAGEKPSSVMFDFEFECGFSIFYSDSHDAQNFPEEKENELNRGWEKD